MKNQLITKFLDSLDISVEKDDRKHDTNAFKKAMAEVATELMCDSEQKRSQRNIPASVTEEKDTLPGVACFFEHASSENHDANDLKT